MVFNSVMVLFIKYILLLILIVFIGLCLHTLINKRKSNVVQTIDLFISLPLGFLFILFIGFFITRITNFLGTGHNLIISAIVALLFCAVIAVFGVRQLLKSKFELNAYSLLILTPIIAGLFPLLPLFSDNNLVYYSGAGTDATGYIRAAQSMLEDWYFSPVNVNNADPFLHPDRGWTYYLMLIEDRPLSFFIIAFVSMLSRSNVFQGYVLSGALAITLLTTFMMILAYVVVKKEKYLPFIAILPIILGIVSLSGNLFHQFFGNVWACVVIIAFGPLLFFSVVKYRTFYLLPVYSFVYGLLAVPIYDLKYAVFSFLILFVALAVTIYREKWVYLLLMLPMFALAVLASQSWEATLRAFSVEKRTFLDVDLYGFIKNFVAEVCLGTTDYAVYCFIALTVLSSMLVVFDLITYFRTRREDPEIHFFKFFILLLFAGCLALEVYLYSTNNLWAADKHLYLFLAVLLTYVFVKIISHGKIVAALIIVVVLNVSYLSISMNLDNYNQVKQTPQLYGVITIDGLLQVGTILDNSQPKLVWFEGNILDYLVFVSYLSNKPWISLAPYDQWYHGGGLYYRITTIISGQDPQKVYNDYLTNLKVDHITVVSKNEMKDSKCFGSYCIKDVAPTALISKNLK